MQEPKTKVNCSVKLTERTIKQETISINLRSIFKSSSVNWKMGDQTNAEPV